jgi:hypothetical protein
MQKIATKARLIAKVKEENERLNIDTINKNLIELGQNLV